MPQAGAAVAIAVGDAVFKGAVALGAAATAASAAGTAVTGALAWATSFSGILTIGSLASSTILARANRPTHPGQYLAARAQADMPAEFLVGKRITAGSFVDRYASGEKNTKHTTVYALAEGWINRCTRVFSGGRLVHSAPLAHGVRTAIPAYLKNGEHQRVYITFYDGRPGQGANAQLIADSGGKWTAQHVGENTAYAVVETIYDSDFMQRPATFQFELEGARLYDRRADTTAGGSGSQRFDDPSSWAYTANPAVAWDHYRLGVNANGVRVFGMGIAPEPYEVFAARADLCDETVSTAGGTQKRYEFHGFISSPAEYGDVAERFAQQMAGEVAEHNGYTTIVAGEAKPAVMTLTDADLVDAGLCSYDEKRGWDDLVSVMAGKFPDPAQMYQPVDYPAVTLGEMGREIALDFPDETDPARVQRLAANIARRAGRQAQLSAPFRAKARELSEGDAFVYESDVHGFPDGKWFEVVKITRSWALGCAYLLAREIDPDDHAWTPDDEADLPPPPELPVGLGVGVLDAPVIDLEGFTFTDGGTAEPALRVTVTGIDPRAVDLYVQIQASDGEGGWAADTRLEPVGFGLETLGEAEALIGRGIFRQAIGPGVLYRARPMVTAPPLVGEWGEYDLATTPNVYRVPSAGEAAEGGPLADALDALEAQDAAEAAARIEAVAAAHAARIAGDELLAEAAGNIFRDPLFRAGKSGLRANGYHLATEDIPGDPDNARAARIIAPDAAAGAELVLGLPGRHAARAPGRLQIAVEIAGKDNVGDLTLRGWFYNAAGAPADPPTVDVATASEGRLAGFVGPADAGSIPDDAVSVEWGVAGLALAAGAARFSVSHPFGKAAPLSLEAVGPFVDPKAPETGLVLARAEETARVARYQRSVVFEQARQADGLADAQGRVTVVENATADHAGRIESAELALSDGAGGLVSVGGALNALDVKITDKAAVYYGSIAPSDPESNDLWVDIDGTLRRYHGSHGWQVVSDPAKNRTFFQPTAPTATADGDIWFDSDDDNRPYRWNGSGWAAAEDLRISLLASAMTAVEAQLGGGGASAIFRMVAGYTPAAGWDARVSFQVRAGAGDTWGESGLYLEAKSDGTSRIVAEAGQLVVSSGGVVSALFDAGGAAFSNARIGTNAVTAGGTSYTSGSISLSNNTWTTVQSRSHTSTGGQIDLTVGAEIDALENSTTTLEVHFRIQRNGVELIDTAVEKIKAGHDGTAIVFPYLEGFRTIPISDTPGAGTHTYTFDVKIIAPHVSAARVISKRSLRVFEARDR